MKKELLLPAALAPLLAACAALPRPEKISVPPYLIVRTEMHETLGEYLELTTAFKVELPDTDRERRAFVESQVAEFNRMRLYKDAHYGADLTLPMNDRKLLDAEAARDARVTKVVPETLTISAKYFGGKKPRVVVTAAPGILDSSGTLRFTLDIKELPGAKKKQAAPAPDETAAEGALPPGKQAADLRAYLLKKYGKSPKSKKAAEVISAAGQPVALVEAELTFYPENGRITFNGRVKNTGKQRLWAGTYLPQLTYRKGRDWFTFSARQFTESLKGPERDAFELNPGAEKKFQYTTDAEVQALVYDSALNMVAPRAAFTSKDEDDLMKLEIFEKYLGGSPEARLEMFPDRRVCEGCGVQLH